ncbi:MAG: type 1 glutamine amidotransferase [Acidimicrobiales bacterium]
MQVVDVHPDLLGTYGDGGNAVVLAQRLRWRGHEAAVHRAYSSNPLPEYGDIYCLGGGEDGPQGSSARAISADGALARAVERGAVVLAVCAGFQVIGESFAGSDGALRAGVGLVDIRSTRGAGRRAVGELLVATRPATRPGGEGWPGAGLLSGYENHGGVTELGPGVAPLGEVLFGVGNGAGTRADGALTGRVVGTYLHGPVLARNPALADQLASWVVGPLAPLDDAEVHRLRAERLAAARPTGLRRLRARA